MSRHCLYCAKELPKGATNNFCSKDCWTEYKKLKAMDVGTDKQATVLLKRSELAESELGEDYIETAPGEESQADAAGKSEADVFDDATAAERQDKAQGTSARKPPTEITSISERLTNLEVLLNERLGQGKADAQGLLDDIARKIDELTIRQHKLEVEMEKVDTFLRTVDKFEDRIRKIERQAQTSGPSHPAPRKGFFARLFS